MNRSMSMLMIAVLLGCGRGSESEPKSDPKSEPKAIEATGGPHAELAAHFNRAFAAGDVYFAGAPSDAASFEKAAQMGVVAVVDLLTEPERESRVGFDEAAVLGELGVRYEWLPTTGANLSVEHAERLDKVLGEADGSVMVHCASSNRAGAVWALYLHHRRGMTLDEAIEAGRTVGLSADTLVEAIRSSASAEKDA